MKQSRKRKIIAIIFIDIVLIAILISCISGNSDKNTSQSPSTSHNTVTIPASATISESTTIPHNVQEYAPSSTTIKQNVQESDPSSSNTQQNVQESKPSSTIITPVPDIKSGMPDKSDLPYYREENAERYDKYHKENPGMTFEQVVIYVNIGLDMEFYEGIKPVENVDSLDVLVNKYNKLPDDFKPELVKLPDTLCVPGVGAQYLRKEARQALLKMNEEAKKEGLDIRAYGTYRSISTQHTIWNNAINSGRTREDVDSLNARGGHSEHHTGLAVDVIKNNYSVEDTAEFLWYKDKAHEYGFIIRYPQGKEHITGYNYEPWHLRYVGSEIASEVYNSGLTYDEYYATYLEHLTN